MKVVHWTAFSGSGMNAVAESCAESEKRLGLDSVLCNIDNEQEWGHTYDADIHVAHTHFPETRLKRRLTKPLKLVFVAHGTPEHVFYESVQASKSGYGHGDGIMMLQHWLKVSDARVTMWPRHQAIFKTMVDKNTPVHLVPLGVDRSFWSAGTSLGKWAGAPSVWSGENCHQIKWPLDLVLMWRWVYEAMDNASLHLNYVPTDLHRWFAPLINATSAGYGMHWSPLQWGKDALRNIFRSVDFFIGLVRYGDHNRLSMEANASGAKTISYPGNPYSDFWIPEGDQRETARVLIQVLKGEIEPRAKEAVPDFMDTARAMRAIYEEIADKPMHVPHKRSRAEPSEAKRTSKTTPSRRKR